MIKYKLIKIDEAKKLNREVNLEEITFTELEMKAIQFCVSRFLGNYKGPINYTLIQTLDKIFYKLLNK